MQAHFGKEAAQSLDGLEFDFNALKREYQNYERWHPGNRMTDKFAQGYEENQVQDMITKLKNKTQEQKSGRFDFQ